MVSFKRLGSEAPPSWLAKGSFTSTRSALFSDNGTNDPKRSRQPGTDHRCNSGRDFINLCCISNSAEHRCYSVRYCPNRARALRKLVPLACRRSRALSARRQRIARLLIAFGVGESAVHCDLHGISLLLAERGYLFGEEFRRHVENDLMKREPHPDAKPMGAFSISSKN